METVAYAISTDMLSLQLINTYGMLSLQLINTYSQWHLMPREGVQTHGPAVQTHGPAVQTHGPAVGMSTNKRGSGHKDYVRLSCIHIHIFDTLHCTLCRICDGELNDFDFPGFQYIVELLSR